MAKNDWMCASTSGDINTIKLKFKHESWHVELQLQILS